MTRRVPTDDAIAHPDATLAAQFRFVRKALAIGGAITALLYTPTLTDIAFASGVYLLLLLLDVALSSLGDPQ